jgi:microcystin degradation protein MlrC
MTRIAILGIQLESNAWAPVMRKAEFEAFGIWHGDAGLRIVEDPKRFGLWQGLGAAGEWAGNWEAVPILLAIGASGGPLDHAVYQNMTNALNLCLEADGPFDAVFIDGHGAGTTSLLDDMDGDYFSLVRACVGPDVPIVATLDLHGNVSRAMIDATDLMIAQRTNPHLDTLERHAEAAAFLSPLIGGRRLFKSAIRVPLLTPQIAQLTAPGQPLARLMQVAESRISGDVASMSLLPGFGLTDCRDNGFAVLGYAWDSQAVADAAVADLAEQVWAMRHEFNRELTSLDDAVGKALAAAGSPDEPPVLLADIADNPGGGALGNTIWILQALNERGANGVQLGLFHDPALVDEAWRHEPGDRFLARFNATNATALSGRYEAEAQLLARSEVRIVSERGVVAGVELNLGRTCAIDLGGIQIAVISTSQQLFEPFLLDACGLDSSTARCFVVKSRGHFRAGFDLAVPDDRIFEVDVPGLTTSRLTSLDWKNVQRPIFPLDRDMHWSARQVTGRQEQK